VDIHGGLNLIVHSVKWDNYSTRRDFDCGRGRAIGTARHCKPDLDGAVSGDGSGTSGVGRSIVRI